MTARMKITDPLLIPPPPNTKKNQKQKNKHKIKKYIYIKKNSVHGTDKQYPQLRLKKALSQEIGSFMEIRHWTPDGGTHIAGAVCVGTGADRATSHKDPEKGL